MDRKEIGRRLRALRGKRTQQEVAKALGITVQALSHWENGNRSPWDDMKVKVAQYYGVNVADIFFS